MMKVTLYKQLVIYKILTECYKFIVHLVGNRIVVANNVGTVTYSSGLVALSGFKPTAIGDGTANLSITVALASSDVTPVRDQILLNTNNNITVSMVDNFWNRYKH